MDFNNLTEEQKAKAEACNSLEELKELAEVGGCALSDEQLEQVTGGGGDLCWQDGFCFHTTVYEPGPNDPHYVVCLRRNRR